MIDFVSVYAFVTQNKVRRLQIIIGRKRKSHLTFDFYRWLRQYQPYNKDTNTKSLESNRHQHGTTWLCDLHVNGGIHLHVSVNGTKFFFVPKSAVSKSSSHFIRKQPTPLPNR